MARTTSALVEGVIETDVSIDLDPFIATASELVEELCEPLGYTDTRLELIERWLSAHFYTVRDTRTSQEQADTVMASYQFKVDLGLDSSMYGQTAKRLDTQGALSSLDEQSKDGVERRPADIWWMGTEAT